MSDTDDLAIPGRHIAIGDVHGCFTALDSLLEVIDLDEHDRLITLGDYVDRGPDSRQVMERLIDLFDAGSLIPLRGNHELMLMGARDSVAEEKLWRSYGGDAAMASYAPANRPGHLDDVPDRHWRFMATDCRDWFETEEFIFVHAGVHPFVPLDRQTEDDLFWQPLMNRGAHCSGKLVICGHTVQRSGEPIHLGHTICIDTGAYDDGWLTALDPGTLEYWQANESGETRNGKVEPAVSRVQRRFWL